MTQIMSLSFEEDIYYDEKFISLKKDRKLSQIVNELLRSYLKISKQSIPAANVEIEQELRELEARKALLKDKQKSLQKQEEEEQKKYKILIK